MGEDIIHLEQQFKVRIKDKAYFATLAKVAQPDMEREDHGIFILFAECDYGGARQELQIILDDPDPNDRNKRILPPQSGRLLMDYIKFWGSSFQRACGDAFVLREEEHNGYIKGLMSKDMKKSFIIADYWNDDGK